MLQLQEENDILKKLWPYSRKSKWHWNNWLYWPRKWKTYNQNNVWCSWCAKEYIL